MNEKKFNVTNNAYKKITLFNEDFKDFIQRFDSGILFVDPPYVEMTSGTYSFSKKKYQLFLEIIKNWKDDVIYTDVFSEEKLKLLGKNWDFIILRNNMGSAIPGQNKKKLFEALYYNFKINNSLW
jgi:site-specific DNA-adenine methylase